MPYYKRSAKVLRFAVQKFAEIGEEEADLPGEVGELRSFWPVNWNYANMFLVLTARPKQCI